MICRESDGIINLTFGDLGRPDQGHLLRNRVSVRYSAIVNETLISSHGSRNRIA